MHSPDLEAVKCEKWKVESSTVITPERFAQY